MQQKKLRNVFLKIYINELKLGKCEAFKFAIKKELWFWF